MGTCTQYEYDTIVRFDVGEWKSGVSSSSPLLRISFFVWQAGYIKQRTLTPKICSTFSVCFGNQTIFHLLGFAKSIFTFTRLVYYTYPTSIFRGCETKTPDSKASYSSTNFGIFGHSADIISLWLICSKWCRNQSI